MAAIAAARYGFALVVAGLPIATLLAFLAPPVLPVFLLVLSCAALAALGFGTWGSGSSPVSTAQAELVDARRRAEEASRAKSRFLAMVSHEVRTPLNGILGMTHLLERTDLSADQESYVTAVRRSAKALSDLVEGLLDFSTIEAGRLELRAETVDLHHLVEDAVELMAPRAHEKNIEIAADIAPDTPRLVRIDQNRLRQVLFNLLGNAIKFTDKGGVSLSVTRERDGVVFVVADTGPGLAPDDQALIFEEFEQVHQGSARRLGGVGLGLSISARILAMMGGAIRVESEIGQGSRFIVSAPMTMVDADVTSQAAALSHKRTLLLAPDGQTAETLTRRITGEGGAVWRVSAPAGEDLDALCRRHDVTDIIVDQRWAEDAESALSAAPCFAAGGPRRILLVRPLERQALETLAARGFDGWLVAPVRRASLAAVLRGAFAATGPDSRHPDNDRLLMPERPVKALDILVAEDDAVNALLITNVLRKEGHSVTLVEDGRALVETAFDAASRQCRFDLIITDLAMPHMDGAMALGLIREHQNAHRLPHVPVVMLSADGQEETRQQMLAAGADLYLQKPIDPANLLRLISRLAA